VGDQVIYNNAVDTVYTVLSINSDTKTLTLSADLTGDIDGTIAVLGYNLQVFNRMAATGEVVEAEPSLGKTFVTLKANYRSKIISDVFAS
jgi:hypothetical protein